MGIRSELMTTEIQEDIIIYVADEENKHCKLKGNTELGAKTLTDFFQLPININSNRISATKVEIGLLLNYCADEGVASVWWRE